MTTSMEREQTAAMPRPRPEASRSRQSWSAPGEATRRFPKGMPLSERQIRINQVQTGRITHGEYDVIDMARITGLRNIKDLAPYIGQTPDSAVRFLNKMAHVGLVAGPPSQFRITDAGWEAYAEADRLMVDEAFRAEYEAERQAAKAERAMRRRARKAQEPSMTLTVAS